MLKGLVPSCILTPQWRNHEGAFGVRDVFDVKRFQTPTIRNFQAPTIRYVMARDIFDGERFMPIGPTMQTTNNTHVAFSTSKAYK